MPVVPTPDGLRVGAEVAPPARFSMPGGPGPAEIGAAQTGQVAQGLSAAGKAAQAIATAMQDQIDQVRVTDALNQARQVAQDLAYNPQSGYLNLKGSAALDRPDGASLPDEYGAKLGEQVSKLAQGMATDRQRQLFTQRAAELQTTFGGQVQAHMLGEFRAHALSVQDGAIALANDEAGRSWQDPAAIKLALDQARAAVHEKGRVAGWSATQIDAATLDTTGKVHAKVILTALENGQSGYATSYLERYRGEMGADDILRVQGHVNKAHWQSMAESAVVGAVTEAAPRMAPGAWDRMVHITEQSESDGREVDAQGRTITSPKGAQGVMQVMPGTNRDPGFGVKPAQDDSPAERARVGRDYLQAMLQRYGDPALAWAAYNAGPGRVDQELRDAAKRGEPGAWLSNMPKETQAYVAKNMAALASGTGPARPSELDFVNAAVARLPAGSPVEAVTLTRQRAQQQWSLMNKAIADRADAALADAQRWLAGNPGATVDQVPAATLDVLRQYAPGKLDDLNKFARAMVVEPTTDMRLYNRLSAPGALPGLSDAEFESLRSRLSPADFKHFAQVRANSKTAAGDANSEAINTAVNEQLRALKIDPTPKDASDEAARVGAVRKFVTDEVLRAQALTGKKMTDAEVRQAVGMLFAQQGTLKGWFGNSTQPVLAMRSGDIPSNVRDALRADFARAGVTDPTDTQVLSAYWAALARTRSR